MAITLSDIARQSSYSITTVSRVLNNHPHVDEATRTTVLEVARTLGYRSDQRASSKRSSSVLLLTLNSPDDSKNLAMQSQEGFNQLIYQGAQPVFKEHGLNVQMQPTDMTPADLEQYRQQGAVGFLLVGGRVPNGFANELIGSGIPFVLVGAHLKPLEVNCIMADVSRGIEQAVEHLVTRGRKNIALVNGPATTKTSEEKYRGFRLALALHGLCFDDKHLTVADLNTESGYQQTLSLLEAYPKLDAILYANDFVAFGGLKALKERGRRVPDNVAVVGFQNYPIANYTDPPLTSVGFDMPLMGTIAARRLVAMLEHDDGQAWFMTLPTGLEIRESS